jgi:hypothetical protein
MTVNSNASSKQKAPYRPSIDESSNTWRSVPSFRGLIAQTTPRISGFGNSSHSTGPAPRTEAEYLDRAAGEADSEPNKWKGVQTWLSALTDKDSSPYGTLGIVLVEAMGADPADYPTAQPSHTALKL